MKTNKKYINHNQDKNAANLVELIQNKKYTRTKYIKCD